MILLYDRECGFCRWAVVWALDHDPAAAIEPVAIQSAPGAKLLADLTPVERLSAVHLIQADGSRLSGGAAVTKLLGQLDAPHGLEYLSGLSPPATEAGYRFVARHRSRFSRMLSSKSKQRADARLAKLTKPGL